MADDSRTMSPKEIITKFAEALEHFKPIQGQPSDSDLTKLMEMHSSMGEDTGAAMDKAAAEKKEKLAGAGGRL